MNENEQLIWEGHPSQWTNFSTFLICGLLCFLLLPIFYALWRWLETSHYIYRVTSERVIITQGVLSKQTNQLELYRVKDTTLIEPFWLRLVSLGHVDLVTSDRVTPVLRIAAVPEAAELREQLRTNIERLRTLKGIREMDLAEVGR